MLATAILRGALIGFVALMMLSLCFLNIFRAHNLIVGTIPVACAIAIGMFEARRIYQHEQRERMATCGQCCAKCGYDIRATISRCPECGAWIECPLKPAR